MKKTLPIPRARSPQAQQGAALVVGLILLIMMTMLVVGAYSLSRVNQQAVSNMQFRDEAVSAANEAIEQVISTNFTVAPAAQTTLVDTNEDNQPDFQVAMAVPVCLSSTPVPAPSPPKSSITLGVSFNQVAGTFFQTLWELRATVTDMNNTGTAVRVRQGVKALVNNAVNIASCGGV
ncbi:MAG TPA: hypothetical protein VM074_07255 [Solimonas sp.]|nr:hypothetical protein [Solimonas sp.]